MRKLMLCILCLLLAAETAFAGGLAGLLGGDAPAELPDPEALLTGGAVLYEAVFELDAGDSGMAYVYPMPENWNVFLMEYAGLCESAGYAMEREMQLGQPAWRISNGGKSAWLIPAYRGALLLVAQKGVPFAPIPMPSPTATPEPTAAPTSIPGGHWEYIVTKQDCFACVNGVCDLCDGSGWYRAYGEKIPCSRYCQTCDGLGWWESTTPVWVYDR